MLAGSGGSGVPTATHSRCGTPGRSSLGGPLRPPTGLSSTPSPVASDQLRGLRLENEVLRCRIQELEQANKELQILAGLAAPSQDSAEIFATDAEGKSEAAGASDETKRACDNCGREIPAGNFDAHVVHCERNFHRCRACREVVPTRDKEQHARYWADPLMALRAVEQADMSVLRNMRAHGTPLEAVRCKTTCESLLHKAARHGNTEMLSLLLSRSQPPLSWLSVLNTDGQGALHVAAAAGHEPEAVLLLESRADVNQPSSAGDTPLLAACRCGSASMVRRLVEAKADINARTALGDTPLQVASRHGCHIDCGLALGTRRRQIDGDGSQDSEMLGPALRPMIRSSTPGSASPSPEPGTVSGAASPKPPIGTVLGGLAAVGSQPARQI
eukprot:TRINITY_DN33370_c0_g2_i1.p1 TRINITY_DN33370_c0_g2~~TRINITY_DN33370_c0_g2_i1.p1  ORF type:complete len:387 (+),score=55.58 TRINITY_DN33370_c0_g2_i1:101-1261(+)